MVTTTVQATPGGVTLPTPVIPDLTPATAVTSTAALVDPTDVNKWAVDQNQLVSNQLTGLLSQNSPYLQQARTSAAQQANSRGLLNTSMAAGAGEAAAIQAALPIAQADAGTHVAATQFNANAGNQFRQSNQQFQNQANQFNATAQNDMSRFNNQNQLDVNKSNAGLLADSTKTALAYDLDTFRANLDADTKVSLANIEASYQTLLGANESAYNIYQQALKNVADIQMNKDLDATAKSIAISNQLTILKNSMELIGAMDNLNLGDILDFSMDSTTIK